MFLRYRLRHFLSSCSPLFSVELLSVVSARKLRRIPSSFAGGMSGRFPTGVKVALKLLVNTLVPLGCHHVLIRECRVT